MLDCYYLITINLMKKLVFFVIAGAIILVPFLKPLSAVTAPASLLYDEFSGSVVNKSFWHIPTWVSPTDGTYIDRTQFRVTQNSPLPSISSGAAKITLGSYNPTATISNPSFYGTDLISNQLFVLNSGVDVTVVAKMDSIQPGTVGGIFLYSLKPGSNTLHDEIDFELMGNQPNTFQTNIYSNEQLGSGHPISYPYFMGNISGYHTYRMIWLKDKVIFNVDGLDVRTETVHVPTGPMYLHLNMWAPGAGWAEAYSPTIQATNVSSQNKTFSMSVDTINVLPVLPAPIITSITSPVSYNGTVTIKGANFVAGDSLLLDEGTKNQTHINNLPLINGNTFTFVPKNAIPNSWGYLPVPVGTHTISVQSPGGGWSGLYRTLSNKVTLVVTP